MAVRKPKPTELKERTSVRPQVALTKLFAVANALVPFQKTEEEKAEKQIEKNLHLEITRVRKLDKDTVIKPQKKKRLEQEESGYGTAVVIPNSPKHSAPREGTVTTPLADVTTPILSPTTSVTRLQEKSTQKQSEQRRRLAFLFLIPALALIAYVVVSPDTPLSSKHAARKSALTQEQINERLEFYRHQTGSKLNRDRINVQIQNFKNAPDLDATDHKIKAPNMMDGLPLQGEAYKNPPKKDLPYDPTYSDAKIAYGLQEEQDRQYFEKQAREQWVRDFIENARKDGYDVKIDAYGNVTSRKIPEEERGPLYELSN